MPEGDTIFYAAKRIRAALVAHEVEVEPRSPRFRTRWAERLDGETVTAVESHGKHLLIRFANDLTIHSHLRMTGKWGVYRHGERWRRHPHRAWVVLRTGEHEVVEFDGPVLEVVTDSRARADPRITGLGPDVLASEFDERGFLRRLREDDPTRGLGDVLLDQRVVAGFGNVWKSEACFAAGLDPWRKVADLSDADALAVIRGALPLIRATAERGGKRPRTVYNRAGLPCPRCGTPVRSRGQGDDNRTTFWCPGCQT